MGSGAAMRTCRVPHVHPATRPAGELGWDEHPAADGFEGDDEPGLDVQPAGGSLYPIAVIIVVIGGIIYLVSFYLQFIPPPRPRCRRRRPRGQPLRPVQPTPIYHPPAPMPPAPAGAG